MIEATVTIVNYNTSAKLRDCLASIQDTCPPGFVEVVVVDNGSRDDSVEVVRREFPDVRLLATGENLGFGRGHNRAMAAGVAPYFIVLNPDTLVRPGAFQRLVQFMRDTPECGACGPAVLDVNRELAHSGHYDFTLWSVAANAFNVRAILPGDRVLRERMGTLLRHVHSAYDRHDQLRDVDWIDGACLVVRREAYNQVGGFDERIFLNCEDFDWCYRIRQAGWRIVHVPDATIVHLMHQSKEQVYVPSFVAHYRSILYLFRKHYGVWSYRAVRTILVIAFSSRLMLSRIERLLPIRRRAAREADAYRAVIRTALEYDPVADAQPGIS